MNTTYKSGLHDCSKFPDTYQDNLTEKHLGQFQLVLIEHESIAIQTVATG